MATYNKRGYKAPKPKEDKIDNEFIDDVAIDATDSTTAGVFNSLDETASRTEDFVARNQKIILITKGWDRIEKEGDWVIFCFCIPYF